MNLKNIKSIKIDKQVNWVFYNRSHKSYRTSLKIKWGFKIFACGTFSDSIFPTAHCSSEFGVIPLEPKHVPPCINHQVARMDLQARRTIGFFQEGVESSGAAVQHQVARMDLHRRRTIRLVKEGVSNVPPGSFEGLIGSSVISASIICLSPVLRGPITLWGPNILEATQVEMGRSLIGTISGGSFGIVYMGCQQQREYKSPTPFDQPLYGYASQGIRGLSPMFNQSPHFGLFVKDDPTFCMASSKGKSNSSIPLFPPMLIRNYYVGAHRQPRKPNDPGDSNFPTTPLSSISLGLRHSLAAMDYFFIVIEEKELSSGTASSSTTQEGEPQMFVNNIRERVLAFKEYINNTELISEAPISCELNDTEDESPPILVFTLELFPVFVGYILHYHLFEYLMVSLFIFGAGKAIAWLILQVINRYCLPLECPETVTEEGSTEEGSTEEGSTEVVNKCTKKLVLDIFGHPVFPFMPGLHFYEDTTIIIDADYEYEIDINPDLDTYSRCPFILFVWSLMGCR